MAFSCSGNGPEPRLADDPSFDLESSRSSGDYTVLVDAQHQQLAALTFEERKKM